jgi:hypothetical protein
MKIKNNATVRQSANKDIITIAFDFVYCYKNGVMIAIETKAEKFVNEFRRPQLIASPILGVNPTSNSNPIKPIGELKKPIKLIAVEIRILLELLVAKAKPIKLIIVIVIEIIAARFKTVIEFFVLYIFIIIRQKKTLPGIPRLLKSIPKVELNLSSANPNGKISYPVHVENTKTKSSEKLTDMVARIYSLFCQSILSSSFIENLSLGGQTSSCLS